MICAHFTQHAPLLALSVRCCSFALRWLRLHFCPLMWNLSDLHGVLTQSDIKTPTSLTLNHTLVMNCLNGRETEGKKGRDLLFFLWQLHLDSAKRQGVYAYFKHPTHFSTPAAEARLMFTLIESWGKFEELIVWLSISSFPSRRARIKGHVPISRTEKQKSLRSDPPALGLFSSSYNINSILSGDSPLKIKKT